MRSAGFSTDCFTFKWQGKICWASVGGKVVSGVSDEGSEGHAEASTRRFYERMDEVMRHLWGEHLHHGLWDGETEDFEQAARRLVSEVGRRLRLRAGARVIDVGCGYGAAGVQLERECGLRVEGVTISPRQRDHAVPGARVEVGDWLAGIGDDGAADGVIAIESLEHMADTELALRHLARVLKPGGRVVLACWVRVGDPHWLERRLLLRPIRHAGHLPGQRSEADLLDGLRRAGFREMKRSDLSHEVARTWRACLRRGLALLRSDPGVFRRLGWIASLQLGITVACIVVAYHVGALRYVVISGARDGSTK